MPRRPVAILVCVLVALAAAGVLGGCGEDEPETEVVEGEPLELGELSYNIQLTRFLNPDDNEDAEYLVDQPPAEPGTAYLGVFLVIENHGDQELGSAGEYIVTDTLDTEYEPIATQSPYALNVGAPVPAEGELPLPNTTPQTGPNQGALLIFLVDDAVAENRPLKLDISSDEGTGEVILDI